MSSAPDGWHGGDPDDASTPHTPSDSGDVEGRLPALSLPAADDDGELDTPFSFVLNDVDVPMGDGESHTPRRTTGFDSDFSPLDLRDRVVIMLLFKQTVSVEQVAEAWREWRAEPGGRMKEALWRALARRPYVDREKIYQEAAEVYAFKEYTVRVEDALLVIQNARRKFKERDWIFMRKAGVFPVANQTLPDDSTKWIFGAFDPTRPDVQQFMKSLRIGMTELVYVPESTINALNIEAFPARNEYLERMHSDPMAFDLGTTYDRERLVDEDALDAEINRSSLINLFEATLVEAVRCGASDIHVWPNAQKKIEIHMRVDGELRRWHLEDRVHPEALLAVVKDNTINVDRFERDNAQDGFLQRRIDDALIRFRVSVMPLANANHEVRSESIVIRVLDDRKVVTDLTELGFLDLAMERFEKAIRQPHGMVILTGPTGSGKSTTLYAALHQVVSPRVNILTIEDPVEYMIPAVRQIKLTHKFGLEDALRRVLRHDPDIVMVGEMRDRVTAELAIKLANTGHLTFSTLHTNDAPSAVSRLYKMGMEPFLIAYAINLVVAQRLIRKLCPDCKVPVREVDEDVLEYLGFDDADCTGLFEELHDTSCRTCGGAGFKGRRAITETMPFTKDIRRIIVQAKGDVDEDALRETAASEGMLSLRDSAREVVRRGETSVAEMIRVTAGEM